MNVIFSGKFHLVNKNGRIEKSVNAHKGATLLGRWSYDGTALFTGTKLKVQFSLEFFLFLKNELFDCLIITIVEIARSAGEDGLVKIWSRSGMLRSTAIRNTQAILTAAWSADCSAICYSQGSFLLLQSLTSNSKPNKVRKPAQCLNLIQLSEVLKNCSIIKLKIN